MSNINSANGTATGYTRGRSFSDPVRDINFKWSDKDFLKRLASDNTQYDLTDLGVTFRDALSQHGFMPPAKKSGKTHCHQPNNTPADGSQTPVEEARIMAIY